MNIILCGMPKSGKTTLGRKLGHQLQSLFYDTDELVQKRYREKTGQFKTCREIYAEHGEPYFRKLEEEIIQRLIDEKTEHAIISLGGGTLLSPTVQKVIQSLGTLIYLQAPEALLWQRISEKSIPAPFQGENPREIFSQQMKIREPLFMDLCKHTISISDQQKKETLESLKAIFNGLK